MWSNQQQVFLIGPSAATPARNHRIGRAKGKAPSDASSSSEATNNPILECPSCGALVWQSESTGRDPRTKELRFTICCNQGQIKLPPMRQPPPVLEKLLQCKQFRETIRVYNALLAFTSIGANIDYSVVFGRGPFTFRIQGQTYHRIGSLLPKPGLPPKYLQLYIFDTANEVKNRLEALGQTTSEGKATEATLKVLIEMVDTNNCLAKVFRRVRDRYEANSEEYFTISLISDKGKGKQYDLPQSYEVVGLIVGEMSDTICERDISGRLLHQYVVDVYSSIEEDRLRWHRLNQDVLRAELYSNVCDAVEKGDTDARTVGKRFILPPSFTGGPRYLIEKYHDAMAICRQFGNPDLFITMTANPNWKEIKDHLAAYGGDSPNDRPDIECRVFKMKLDQLLDDFKKGTFFAPYTAALHRIEFQKRGLPHAHILLWFGDHSRTPKEEIDKIISAELPDKQKDPEAYELVAKHMIHGPCGLDRPRSPCMENHVCAKKFPRPFTESTSIDKSGYIIYRRRKNENANVLKDGILLDNASVIPYNIEILKKYAAHINVEWCNRTSAIKYLFKYITKGVDRATVLLVVHLEGEHNITIKDTDNLGRVIQKPGIEKTMFTEWMVLCRTSAFARTLTYVQIPEFFTWNNSSKVWSERKRGTSIGRVVTVHPASGDRYYLRILINKVKGPRSYTELRTFNGVTYPDFKSTCCARGLLANDAEWHESMAELNTWGTPSQLREMFVTLLVYCHVANPKELWDKCWKTLSEDILYKKHQFISIDRTLVEEVSSDPHKQILEATYGRTDQWKGAKQDYTERAILTPRNETVDEINEYMISEADGVSKEYLSSDSFGIIDTDSANNETLYPVEYLNSLSFPGLPAHKLTLKVGAPFMLLRNLNQKKGLCNGTRLIVTYLGERVIRGEIVTGSHIGHKVDLPRIILSESVTKHPFTLERRQFPIRLCYAMTINKSQGQSLKGVVLYLPRPVFTHGQLYVGLSRVTTKSGLKIIQGKDQKIGRIKNIVYKEIYNGLPGNQILFATQFTTPSINTQLISLSTLESISDDHPEQASRNLQQLTIP
ncbi:unnamed protein product [Brassica rapa]|uniref:ATP-dependent DNA helicase n=1 Tax=Brassica campestris TaxID=3711 RepID=A0A8D9M0A9_BRACM|nr:unnamed protein product [Brassica rapa]